MANRSKTSCFKPDRTFCYPKGKPEAAAEWPQLHASVERSRLRLRLTGQARRYGAADTVEAGEHNGALARTRRGAPKLDLKRPEQSLEARYPNGPLAYALRFSGLSPPD